MNLFEIIIMGIVYALAIISVVGVGYLVFKFSKEYLDKKKGEKQK